MAKPSRHELIIREEIEDAEPNLESARKHAQDVQIKVERIEAQLAVLRGILARADEQGPGA